MGNTRKLAQGAAVVLLGLVACIAVSAATPASTPGGMTLTQDWKWEGVCPYDSDGWVDMRQGFGHDNRFYIQNKNAGSQCIAVYDQHGATGLRYASGLGSNFTHDWAMNMIVRLGQYPLALRVDTPEFRLIKADGSAVTDVTLPADCPALRTDYFGTASGDIFSTAGGTLMITSMNEDRIYVMHFAQGRLERHFNIDHQFVARLQGDALLHTGAEDVIEAWRAADGTTHYTYVNPTRNPVDFMLDANDQVTGAQAIDVQQLGEQVYGTSCGFGAFALAGANYVMLSSSPNWNDGFVVARLGVAATSEVDGSTLTVVARHDNEFTGRTTRLNWLNAEPRDTASVYIYQWNPGGYIARYILAPEASAVAETAASDATVSSVTYVGPTGIVSRTPMQGVNIVVTRYADGTCQRSKLLAR